MIAQQAPSVGRCGRSTGGGRRRGRGHHRPDRPAARGAHLDLDDVDELVDAIRRLAVRGAPRSARPGRSGWCSPSSRAGPRGWDDDQVADAIGRVRDARPTAVNLAWGVDRIAAVAAASPGDLAAVEAAARAVLDEDVAANRAIGERGADLLAELCAAPAAGDEPAAPPHALQRRRAGLRRVGHRARRRPDAARPRRARPRATPTRPARCSRAPGSRPGSSTGWASTTGSSSTAPGRR